MTEPEAIRIGMIAIVAVLIAAVARNRGFNPSLPVLGAGLLFGFLPIGPEAPADPEFVLVVVLAPLVFGEALSSSIIDLRRVSRPVMALAIGLVVVGAFVVGAVAHLMMPQMPLTVALCLGAILGPTDAVAVAATARAVSLPRRVVTILEGESLVNDGTALTLLRVCAVAAAAGTVTAGDVTVILFESILGGVLAGVLGGFLLALVIRRFRDTTVANGIILIAPLPLYVAAERLEGSGILAVVIAALILAHATSSAISYAGRLQAAMLWRTITFLLQAVAFFLVGIDVPAALGALSTEELRSLLYIVPAVLLTLIVTRFVFVFGMAASTKVRTQGSRAWLVVAWAGTRGPVSALAAFTLPMTTNTGAPFPGRDMVICITFCVVVLSLLLAPTMGPLARVLHLPREDDTATVHRVQMSLARAAIDRLDEMEETADRAEDPIPRATLKRLRTSAEARLDRLDELEGAPGPDAPPVLEREMRLSMVHAEQEELLRMRDEEGLPDDLVRSVQKELDVRARAAQAM